MKNFYKYCAVALLGLTAASCTNFLEEEPNGKMVAENFFKSENDLTMAMNALYNQVAVSKRNSNPFIIQLQGDDITINTSSKEAYLSADAYKDPSDTKGPEALWSGCYNVIQAANLIIDNAEKADASESAINIALGNALYWRAVSYFELVRVFGPLPVNLHNLPDGNKTEMTGVKEIYDEIIIADLVRANSLDLPTTYSGSTYGFAEKTNYWCSQQCVKATLAAVYMNRAGYPFFTAGDNANNPERKEFYKKAAALLSQVYKGVKNNKYAQALEQDYREVYSPGNNWSAEQLMTISFWNKPGAMGNEGGVNPSGQFSKCQTPEQFQGGWIDFMGEYKWWAEYPEGPRKKAVYEESIYTKTIKDKTTNTVVNISWWATKDKKPVEEDRSKNAMLTMYHPTFASMQINADKDSNPLQQPYDCTQPAYDGQSYPQNQRFIRYSEALCWFAECVGRGQLSEYAADARAALQEVMDRAYAPGTAPVAANMTDEKLAEQALLEHGYEVTGYPVCLVTRRADLFRLDRLKDVWEYRNGPQTTVLVPTGTPTLYYTGSARAGYKSQIYNLDYDLSRQEDNKVAEKWRDYESIYDVYPPTEIIKNPNIKRVSAMD